MPKHQNYLNITFVQQDLAPFESKQQVYSDLT